MLLILHVTATLGGGMTAPIAPALSFLLTDQQGRLVSSTDLRSKVVVADFIYTACTDICPALPAQMAALRNRRADEGLRSDEQAIRQVVVDSFMLSVEVMEAAAAAAAAHANGTAHTSADDHSSDYEISQSGRRFVLPPAAAA